MLTCNCEYYLLTCTYKGRRAPHPRSPPMVLPCSTQINLLPSFSSNLLSLIICGDRNSYYFPSSILTCLAFPRRSRCSPWTHLLWCRDPEYFIWHVSNIFKKNLKIGETTLVTNYKDNSRSLRCSLTMVGTCCFAESSTSLWSVWQGRLSSLR